MFVTKIIFGILGITLVTLVHSKAVVKRNAEDDCIADCKSQLRKNITSSGSISGTNVASDEILTGRMKPEDLERYCQNFYKPYDKCLDHCPDSDANDYYQSIYLELEYICWNDYEGSKKNYACVYKVNEESQDSCGQRCANVVDDEMNTNDNETLVEFNLPCNKIKCMFVCQTETVSKQCGDDGVAYFRNSVKALLRSAQDRSMYKAGRPLSIECERLLYSLTYCEDELC